MSSNPFICNQLWRNSILRVLAKPVEVVAKDNYEEIDSLTIGSDINQLLCQREIGKEITANILPGLEQISDTDLRNYPFKGAQI